MRYARPRHPNPQRDEGILVQACGKECSSPSLGGLLLHDLAAAQFRIHLRGYVRWVMIGGLPCHLSFVEPARRLKSCMKILRFEQRGAAASSPRLQIVLRITNRKDGPRGCRQQQTLKMPKSSETLAKFRTARKMFSLNLNQ